MLCSLILSASPSRRQEFLNLLGTDQHNLRIIREEELPIPPDVHTDRIEDWLDHHALDLAVEAFASDRSGAGLCLSFRDASVIASLAIHASDSTSLHHLECPQNQADQLFEFLKQKISNPSFNPEIPSSIMCRHRTAAVSEQLDFDRHPTWILEQRASWRPHTESNIAAICPGSFFPLHEGHRKMRNAAEESLGGRVIFELTVRNADKPPLDYLSLETRASQFQPGELVLSAVPRFDQKAELFPDCAFVLGYDTALRVLDRRFYPQGELESALDRIESQNCRFVVASRRIGSQLRTRDDLEIPARFENLFEVLPDFLEDVSSSEIRDAYWRGESETGPVPIL